MTRKKHFAIKIVQITGLVRYGTGAGPAGQYIKEADVDAYDGRGDVAGTFNPQEALQFDSSADAMKFWRQQSTVRPLREDGQPNRPLTAFSVEIVKV